VYLEHWGLECPPFRITPDTRRFYTGARRGDILQALEYAVLGGEGIVKVSGEVGSGKTMLCRMLEERLADRLEVVYLGNPSLSPVEVLRAIALEMGLAPAPDEGHLQLIQRLHQALLERCARGRAVVVFIEEAQSMSPAALEEIRLLSNLETGSRKLLQMVLFGQPELDETLARPEIRQLKERITQNFHLPPFRRREIADYLRFRMAGAGYRGPDVFTRGAVRRIARASRGLARRVSILADKALLAAYARGSHRVTGRHVKLAVADSDFGVLVPRRRPWLRPALAGIGLGLMAAGGWWAAAHWSLAWPDPTAAVERMSLLLADAFTEARP